MSERRVPKLFSVPRRWAWFWALTLPAVVVASWLSLVPHAATRTVTVSAALLVLTLSVAAVADACWHKIPNWATYPAAIWAIGLNAWSTWGASAEAVRVLGTVGLADCLLGGMVLFSSMFFVYALSGGGAGDVKLAAVIGAWLGLNRGVEAVLYSLVLAGAVTFCWAIWKHGPVSVFGMFLRAVGSRLLPAWVPRPSADQERLLTKPCPLGGFFAAGTLVVLFDAPLGRCLRAGLGTFFD